MTRKMIKFPETVDKESNALRILVRILAIKVFFFCSRFTSKKKHFALLRWVLSMLKILSVSECFTPANYISYAKYVTVIIIHHQVVALFWKKFTNNGENVCFVNENSEEAKIELISKNSIIFLYIYIHANNTNRLSSPISYSVRPA